MSFDVARPPASTDTSPPDTTIALHGRSPLSPAATILFVNA
jgi:hypothetical protein